MTNQGWRLFGVLGGALGLLSLVFPYLRVTESVGGFGTNQTEYTLLEVLSEVTEHGDPEAVYGVVLLIVGGSLLALLGSIVSSWLVSLGGVMQGVGAGAIGYAVATERIVFAAGIGSAEMEPLLGLYVIGIGALVSVLAVVAE